MILKIINKVGFCLSLLVASFSLHSRAEVELLKPSEAFQIRSAVATSRGLDVEFNIAPGYYLYADRFVFEIDNKIFNVLAADLPPGHKKYDELSGKEITYYRGVVLIHLRLDKPSARYKLTAQARGCADAGVCYPTVSRTFEINEVLP